MLVKKEKELLKKLTCAVGAMLEKANTKWTDREISELSKVPTNRLTEYKAFGKYQRSITMNNFMKLLIGGFFTVEDIINAATDLTEEEKRYLRDMNLFETSAFRKEVIESKKKGIDPIRLHALANELKGQGIDVMEVLERLREKID